MVKRKKESSRVGEALREYVAAPVDVAAAIDAAEVVEDFPAAAEGSRAPRANSKGHPQFEPP